MTIHDINITPVLIIAYGNFDAVVQCKGLIKEVMYRNRYVPLLLLIKCSKFGSRFTVAKSSDGGKDLKYAEIMQMSKVVWLLLY